MVDNHVTLEPKNPSSGPHLTFLSSRRSLDCDIMKLAWRLLYHLILFIYVSAFKRVALKSYFNRLESQPSNRRLNRFSSPLLMGFGDNIASKFTGILELIVGQSEITEKNIEDTLKVSMTPRP